jgi:exonuclease VII large subunit
VAAAISRTGPPVTERVLRVRDVVRIVSEQLHATIELRDLWVEGEVSSVSTSPRVHVYFTLKDVNMALDCMLGAE